MRDFITTLPDVDKNLQVELNAMEQVLETIQKTGQVVASLCKTGDISIGCVIYAA